MAARIDSCRADPRSSRVLPQLCNATWQHVSCLAGLADDANLFAKDAYLAEISATAVAERRFDVSPACYGLIPRPEGINPQQLQTARLLCTYEI